MINLIIDRNAIARLLDVIGGDIDDLKELVNEFEDVAPEMQKKMREAVSNEDFNALRILAHSLKSNARDFGATRLAKLCEQLERDCKSGIGLNASSHVGLISDELEAATAALTKLSYFND